MRLEVSFCCDVGNSRENNEDGILVGTGFFRNARGYVSLELSRTDFPMIFAVADGVGGEEYGEVASEILLKTLSEMSPHSLDLLKNALLLARERFKDFLTKRNLTGKMSSTVAGIIFVSEDSALVFNVGDTRVYQIKSGYAYRITRDHSVVETLIQTGKITPEEALSHPQRHVLTSCISSDNTEFEIFAKQVKPFPENLFLICSDGLWEFVKDEEIEETIAQKQGCHASVLVERAKRNGSSDNISAIVISVE